MTDGTHRLYIWISADVMDKCCQKAKLHYQHHTDELTVWFFLPGPHPLYLFIFPVIRFVFSQLICKIFLNYLLKALPSDGRARSSMNFFVAASSYFILQLTGFVRTSTKCN